MSILGKLFGGGAAKEAKASRSAEHKGFTITATPYKEGGQFQTCGEISKEIDGTRKTHRFVRADRFASEDEAADFAIAKGRLIVDEQGERLFR
jgi:hypothetical protein